MAIDELLNRGIAALKAGHKEKARNLLTQAVQLDQQDETAWMWLSGAVETDQERRTCLENVLAINPHNETAWQGLAALSAREGVRLLSVTPLATPDAEFVDQAPSTRDQAIKPDLDDATAYNEQGNARVDQDDPDGAIADFGRATELAPDDAITYNNRGSARYDQGDLAGAIDDFSKAIELAPDYATAHFNRGSARYDQGDLTGAIADYTTAIELDPNDAAAYESRGSAHRELGDAKAALADLGRYLELEPDVEQRQTVEEWIVELEAQDDDKVTELCPDDATAHHQRGLARKAQGDLDGAIADLTQAIELAPDDAITYNNRGSARYDQGDLAGAIADFSTAIELAPDYAIAHFNRGSARYDQGDLAGAIADFSRAIELAPDYAIAHSNRGSARADQGDLTGAIADYTTAIELDPNDAAAYESRGSAHRELGDAKAALADFGRYLELEPDVEQRQTVEGRIAELEAQVAGPSPLPHKGPALPPVDEDTDKHKQAAQQRTRLLVGIGAGVLVLAVALAGGWWVIEKGNKTSTLRLSPSPVAAIPPQVPTNTPTMQPDTPTWNIQPIGPLQPFSGMRDRSLCLDADGRPRIVYGDDRFLYYAWYDGATWRQETVDNVSAAGQYTSLALDASGLPHVSYFDVRNSNLKYAHWTGNAWDIQIVDNVRNSSAAGYTSLALDAFDHPHISYYGDQALNYASWTGSAWDIQTVSGSGDAGEYSSLALDAFDRPHISYYDATRQVLKYARWTGNAWGIQTVGNDRGMFISLALSALGYPHISYYDWTNDHLKYARWTGNDWNIQTVDSGEAVGWYTSLVLDTGGYPHIGYFDGSHHDLRYAHWTGSAWDVQTVDSEGWVGEYTSLALDADGYPHISYYDASTRGLKYATTGSLPSLSLLPDEQATPLATRLLQTPMWTPTPPATMHPTPTVAPTQPPTVTATPAPLAATPPHTSDLTSGPSYTITDLTTLIGWGSNPRDLYINNLGQIAGVASFSGGTHAFRWTNGVGIVDLGSLGGWSKAYDINDNGQVTGVDALQESGAYGRAFRYTDDGGMENLRAFRGRGDSFGLSINASGEVVGWGNQYTGAPASPESQSNPGFASRWVAGSLHDLGTLGGYYGAATGNNDNGQIAGYSAVEGDVATHAFLWTVGGGMVDLGTLGGTNSQGLSINNAGQVAGWAEDSNDDQHAFLFSADVGMIDLGTLDQSGSSHASDINNLGQIVGRSNDRAFLWENGAMTDLNNLVPSDSGWVLRAARGINDAGQIVGWGDIDDQTHAFLLTLASAQYAISGRVADAGNTPIADVTIAVSSGASAVINASGVYAFTSLVTGDYTLTATKDGYMFSPVSRTVSVPPDATGQDFTGVRSVGGVAWDIQVVDSAGDVFYTSLALDAYGHPHISYYGDGLKYARWTGSDWDVQIVDSDGDVGKHTSLALDAYGHPHISYYDDTNGNLKYAHWTGSDWDIQTVDSTGSLTGGVGWYTSLALDAGGYPHISYFDLDNRDLKYTYWTGSAWNIQTVDSDGDVGWSTSLALDTLDHPHISYHDNDNGLKYARWTSDAWDIQIVSNTTSVGYVTSLALDTSGHPHISYSGSSYAHWMDNAWVIETVDGFGGYTSLMLDAAGYPHISYYDFDNQDLKYIRWTGSAWDIQIVDSTDDIGRYTSLALDALGDLHISYVDSGRGVKYARLSLSLLSPGEQATPLPTMTPTPTPTQTFTDTPTPTLTITVYKSYSDPIAPLADYFEAFEERDTEKVVGTVCQQDRALMQFALENIFGAVEMLGGEIKVKDLRLELEDKKDDLATVVATGGTLELTVADETQVYVIEEIEPVKVIKKDGTWVICDEALITTGPVNFISINLPEACLGSFLTVYMVALMLVMTLLFWALPRLYRRPFAQEIRQIWKQHK